ncbi:MAG: SpoIVB peptidase [Firmicutes bacterium]|nr:SpoIVB peptidase [Bacillota bacterium]
MKKAFGLLAAGLLLLVGLSRPSSILCTWPKPLWLPTRHTLSIPWSRWLPIEAEASPARAVEIDHHRDQGWTSIRHRVWYLRANHQGVYRLRYRMMGMVPFGTSWVRADAPLSVVPGGEAIGIMVRTKGLIVRALVSVQDDRGQSVCPAEQAGLRVGDLITAANRRPLLDQQSLDRAMDRAGRKRQPMDLTVRASGIHHIKVTPIWSTRDHAYVIGAAVRDGMAGVGTLTYFEPSTGQYGALGHSMTDGLTRIPAPVSSGSVSGADIISVIAAGRDKPGQKVGILAAHGLVSGMVWSNGQFGIHGKLLTWPKVGLRAIPVAYPDQVHPGAARLITVLHGQKERSYHIQIIKAYAQTHPATKGVLFRVTDRQLLQRTGGIIQGMSGSPIIEDGRLVGAVTHVMVGKPWIGYGCYAVWMLGLKSGA